MKVKMGPPAARCLFFNGPVFGMAQTCHDVAADMVAFYRLFGFDAVVAEVHPGLTR